MGITDDGIKAVGEYVKDVTIDVIKEMVDEDSGMISVYYGEDTTEEDAMALKSVLEEQFEDLEVDVRYGGQPIYYYILSVE
jgi:dihydroxyacetone kinase-like predicted kinase